MTIRLAQYQTRLLLGTPSGRQHHRLLWKCGCIAREIAQRKLEVGPCCDHAPLLREVREDDEPTYDSFSAPRLRYPSEHLA